MNFRRIGRLLQTRIADLVCRLLLEKKNEWLKGDFIDIGDVRIFYPEDVDLEGINLLQGVLPASIGHRGLVFYFLLRLTKIDIELGTVDKKVRYETTMQKRSPMHPRV